MRVIDKILGTNNMNAVRWELNRALGMNLFRLREKEKRPLTRREMVLPPGYRESGPAVVRRK